MKRFNDILCVVESGKTSAAALERAVTLAENNQASLTVVSVAEQVIAGIGMPPGGPISSQLQAALVKTHAGKLETLVEPYRSRTGIETRVLTGVPFLEIIREVLRNNRDLVIKVPETRDWLDRFMGSDDMHLLRKCPCPVWMVKPQVPQAYRRILAAVDVDTAYPADELETRHQLNLQVLEMASSQALSDFAELHIVCAWHAVGESAMHGAFINTPEKEIIAYVEEVRRTHEDNLDKLTGETIGNLGAEALAYLKPRKHLLKGWARKEVPLLAREIKADLVVMGTVGRTGVPGFLMGNTAETILNQIDCSVLAVKPPGFETPVTLQD
ncbi:MAG: universal stress protein [Gammaproteobacteria bacterium]